MDERGYDERCYELAQFFLDDEQPGLNTEQHRVKLALMIQQAVEDYLFEVGTEAAEEPTEPGA